MYYRENLIMLQNTKYHYFDSGREDMIKKIIRIAIISSSTVLVPKLHPYPDWGRACLPWKHSNRILLWIYFVMETVLSTGMFIRLKIYRSPSKPKKIYKFHYFSMTWTKFSKSPKFHWWTQKTHLFILEMPFSLHLNQRYPGRPNLLTQGCWLPFCFSR